MQTHVHPWTLDNIVTYRLTLRPMQAHDADALHRLMIQPGVRRHLWDDRILPRAQIVELLAHSAQLRAQEGTGLWALAPHADAHEMAGFVGLWPFHDPPVSELSFALADAHRGRGLATEAGAAILAYARDTLGWHAIQASTDVDNHAAVRTLRRLDFREARIVAGLSGRLRVFGRAL